MKVKLFAATALLILTATILDAPGLAQNKPATPQTQSNQQLEKHRNIRNLLNLTGTKKLVRQQINQFINIIKTQYPQVPAKYWSTFLAETNVDELINRIIPIYSKYYTNEDIKELLKFYQTPLGKKTIATLPQITTESTEIGRQYGVEVAKRAIQKLEAEGYIPRR